LRKDTFMINMCRWYEIFTLVTDSGEK